jgi:DNA-directed RNA polymerase sigma subunit (sigma70/sigma32)
MRVGARLEAASEQSVDALKLIQLGRRARDKFVTSNLRLVHWVVREFRYAALDYEDIVQEGSKGLIRAVEMFDPDSGYRFSGPLCVFGVRARPT